MPREDRAISTEKSSTTYPTFRGNRALILAGYATLLLGLAVLLLPFGYNKFPCTPPLACLIIPNPIAPVVLYALLLASVALAPIAIYARATRAAGVVAIGGMLILTLGTLLLWGRWFTFGGQSIEILSTSPIWVPVIKLGATVLGSSMVIVGCVSPFRGRVSPRRGRTAIALTGETPPQA